MDRVCGDCANYNDGNLESPCSENNRYCGYLKENMPCWKPKEGKADVVHATKVCAKCGEALPLRMFRKTRLTDDGLSVLCINCKPYPGRKKRKTY